LHTSRRLFLFRVSFGLRQNGKGGRIYWQLTEWDVANGTTRRHERTTSRALPSPFCTGTKGTARKGVSHFFGPQMQCYETLRERSRIIHDFPSAPPHVSTFLTSHRPLLSSTDPADNKRTRRSWRERHRQRQDAQPRCRDLPPTAISINLNHRCFGTPVGRSDLVAYLPLPAVIR
jgi:hypothetical protein